MDSNIIEVNDDITDDLLYKVKEAGSDVTFRINSCGGNLSVAFAIYSYIRSNDIRCTTIVDGYCMSAATIILLAAPIENREATEISMFMVHSPSIPLQETDMSMSDAAKTYDMLRALNESVVKIYNERCTIDNESLKDYMDKEITFNAESAKEFGFIGNIVSFSNNLKTNKMDLIKYFSKILNISTKEGKEFPCDDIKVGSKVNIEDGIYVLEDGSKVTVKDGAITEVEEPVKEAKPVEGEPAKDGCGDKKKVKDDGEGTSIDDILASINEVTASLTALSEKVDALEKSQNDLASQVEELKISVGAPKEGKPKDPDESDIKNIVKEVGSVKNLKEIVKNATNSVKPSFVSDNTKKAKASRSLRDLINL